MSIFMYPKLKLLNASVFLVMAGFSTQLYAQATDIVIPTQQLETIVVVADTQSKTSLATKTPNELQQIPQAIQVINQQQLQEQHLSQLNDVMRTIPNVVSDNSAGNRAERHLIRGFRSTAYSVDGFVVNPTLDRSEVFLDFADVEQVEVLKGPSSVLFGRSDPGGVINISSKQPSDEFKADAELALGAIGHKRIAGNIRGALNADKTLTARATGAIQRDESYRDGERQTDKKLLSGAMRWQSSDRFKIDLTARYAAHHAPFNRGLVLSPNNQVDLPRETFLAEHWSQTQAKKASLTIQSDYQMNDHLLWRNRILWADSSVTDTGIDYRDIRNQRQLRRRYNDRSEDGQNINATSEFIAQFNTNRIQHHVLAGVDLARGHLIFKRGRANIANIDIYDPQHTATMPVATLDNHYQRTIHTLGIYAQDQLQLSPQWKVLLGGRYDYVKEHYDDYFNSTSSSKKEQQWTGRIGAVYQFNDDWAWYANLSQGFMPQSGQDKYGAFFKPEHSLSYETGLKFYVAPLHTSANIALFHVTKKNVAVTDPSDSNFSILTGKQRAYGVELDWTTHLTDTWKIKGSLGYTQAQVIQDTTITTGNSLAGVPKWNASLWTNHSLSALGGGFERLRIGTGIAYVGKRYGDIENSFSVPSYYRVDASIDYDVNDHIQVALVGKNITDKYYVEAVGSKTEINMGSPRKWLATVKFHY